MPKPVCIKCGLFFKNKKSGIVWEEGMPDGAEPVRYTEPGGKSWSSYKLWRGDLYQCRGCGTEVIVGHALQNFAEHYQPDYETTRTDCGGDKIPFVHDC